MYYPMRYMVASVLNGYVVYDKEHVTLYMITLLNTIAMHKWL